MASLRLIAGNCHTKFGNKKLQSLDYLMMNSMLTCLASVRTRPQSRLFYTLKAASRGDIHEFVHDLYITAIYGPRILTVWVYHSFIFTQRVPEESNMW